jgi:ankyrin repeat protein
MGQQQSKDELLYQQVNCSNIEGIKNLCREGARLEVPIIPTFFIFRLLIIFLNKKTKLNLIGFVVQWIDKEGKTPLIVACLNPQLFNVAKTLIELGANVNAYRPGIPFFTNLNIHLLS